MREIYAVCVLADLRRDEARALYPGAALRSTSGARRRTRAGAAGSRSAASDTRSLLFARCVRHPFVCRFERADKSPDGPFDIFDPQEASGEFYVGSDEVNAAASASDLGGRRAYRVQIRFDATVDRLHLGRRKGKVGVKSEWHLRSVSPEISVPQSERNRAAFFLAGRLCEGAANPDISIGPST
jgi:hypothetical protein